MQPNKTAADNVDQRLAVPFVEAARMLGVPVKSLHDLRRRGAIKAVAYGGGKFRRRYLVPLRELEKFLASGEAA